MAWIDLSPSVLLLSQKPGISVDDARAIWP